MRSIVSPLSGIRSPFGLRDGASVYAILGLDPALVFDFVGNYYRKSATGSTFGASITHAATTNATMVDSDGLLKWRPHNRVTSSGDLTGTSWSAIRATYDGPTETLTQVGTTVYGILTQAAASLTVGARYKYTIRMKAGNTGWGVVAHVMTSAFWVKTWFDLSSGTVGTVGPNTTATIVNAGDGWWDCSVEAVATVTSANISAQMATNNGGVNSVNGDTVLVRQVHAFRSDLGGMVNNPDTSSSYVPTTSAAAVYAPRRGHHHYNGSAWVNEGILHESEARTNLLDNSGDLAGSGWSNNSMTVGAVTTGSPFGTYQTVSPSSTIAGASSRYQIGHPLTGGTTYVGWALVKYSAGNGWFVIDMYDSGKNSERCWFDLQNGVVGSKEALIIDHGMINYGDGWWLCWASSASTNVSGGLSVEVATGDGVLASNSGDVILFAGSQFEAGSTASSYIPTTTAAVTRAAETLTVPAANLPYDSTNMSIQIDGKMTYADTGIAAEVGFTKWFFSGTNNLSSRLDTAGAETGRAYFKQEYAGTNYIVEGPADTYSPSVNVPFNIASRHGSTFINGAVGGTALTANTTPTALPDLSSTDLELCNVFMGTIGQFRMWSDDLGDVGITEATLPSTEPSLSLTFDGSETSFTVLDWSE